MVAPLSSGGIPRSYSATAMAAAGLPHASARIAVVGSLNIDVVMTLDRVPNAGETVLADDLNQVPGGKGGNQAVACARHGAQVSLFGAVGRDHAGNTLRLALHDVGVDVDHIAVLDDKPTGIAMIMVESNGQNRICVVPGANAELELNDDTLMHVLAQADYVLLQLETPMPVVDQVLRAAQSAGCRVVLNPSPVQALPQEWWSMVHTLVLNEHEAAWLSGQTVESTDSAIAAAKALLARGVQQVVVTLGGQGVVTAIAQDGIITRTHSAIKVPVVDTTAAGDTFLGAMVTRLAEGETLDDAVSWGIRAASLCIGKHGAQPSIPAREEVQNFARTGELV